MSSVAAFAPKDRVVDHDQPADERTAIRVIEHSGERADEHRIEALSGSPTVADVNEDYSPTDTVVKVGFERDLGQHVPGWRDLPTAEFVSHVEGTDVTIYSYPEGRLETVTEKWEPSGDTRTSGRRERDRLFGEHPEAVEAFIGDARRLFTEPAIVADELREQLTVGAPATDRLENADAVLADMTTPPPESTVIPRPTEVTPTTRGECGHTRSDNYRPEDDDALVCWHCSDQPHNRPRKFDHDDAAGESCSQGSPRATVLRTLVIESTVLSGRGESIREVYGPPRRFVRDLFALRSGDDDKIRSTALRMAYRPHLEDVEEYNYHRALALLRDHDVAAELPMIGSDDEGGADT